MENRRRQWKQMQRGKKGEPCGWTQHQEVMRKKSPPYQMQDFTQKGCCPSTLYTLASNDTGCWHHTASVHVTMWPGTGERGTSPLSLKLTETECLGNGLWARSIVRWTLSSAVQKLSKNFSSTPNAFILSLVPFLSLYFRGLILRIFH